MGGTAICPRSPEPTCLVSKRSYSWAECLAWHSGHVPPQVQARCSCSSGARIACWEIRSASRSYSSPGLLINNFVFNAPAAGGWTWIRRKSCSKRGNAVAVGGVSSSSESLRRCCSPIVAMFARTTLEDTGFSSWYCFLAKLRMLGILSRLARRGLTESLRNWKQETLDQTSPFCNPRRRFKPWQPSYCANDRFRSNTPPLSLPRKKVLRNFVAFFF